MSKLDAKGRCCGRKPLDYKRGLLTPSSKPHKFCTRCDREYDRVTGEQTENWAHRKCPGCGNWIAGAASACGECTCEQEGCA